VLVAAIAAALLVVWQNRPDEGTDTAGDTPATSSPAPTSAAETTEADVTTPSTTAATTPPTTTATPPPPPPATDGPVTAAEMQQFVTDYYSLLPGNPDAAYALTGPTLRGVSSPGDYRAFWSNFRAVTLSNPRASDGELVVTAQVTFVENDGDTFPEQHRIELVETEDGQLLVDSDRAV
jgi:hypothetical protein